jgi:radical SAM superfamily enzyme YgiQ (UPF0313 family)
MKKAGCRVLHVGFESSDVDILRNVKKGQNPKIMEEFTKNAKKAGIIIKGDFIIGLPGETKETIIETIKWAKKLNIMDYQFVVPQPEPNTPFYEWLIENQYLTEDLEVSYPNLSHEELAHWRLQAYKQIYLRPDFLKNIFYSINRPDEIIRIFKMGLRALPSLLIHRTI